MGCARVAAFEMQIKKKGSIKLLPFLLLNKWMSYLTFNSPDLIIFAM
jgi:hypothetical protein